MKIGKIPYVQLNEEDKMKTKIILLLIIPLVFSCENKHAVKNSEIYRANVHQARQELIFPDTIYIDSIYIGHINYIDEFDKYTKTVNEESGVYRLIDFNYVFNDYLITDDSKLEKMVNERSPAFNVHKIELKPIQPKKKGVMYLQGFIKDLVVFDTIKNISYDEPIDGIEQKYFIRKKVVVR